MNGCELWVCVNHRIGQPSCGGGGSERVAAALERRVKDLGWAVAIIRTPCQGRCSRGPIVRALPDLALFFGVTPDNLAPVLDAARARSNGAALSQTSTPDPDARPNPLAPPWIFGN